MRFWGYETSVGPTPWYRSVLTRFNIGRRTQTIKQLGEHLWSDLKYWLTEDSFDEVKLVGHSMGGLVVVAAAAYGLAGDDQQDLTLKNSLKGIALIATPLAGASLAGRAAPLFHLFGENIHVADLRANSISRKELVTTFVHELENAKHINLTIFRAANDGVVEQNELIQPLTGARYNREVLTGAHSECVQNLEAGSANLGKLVGWIRQRQR